MIPYDYQPPVAELLEGGFIVHSAEVPNLTLFPHNAHPARKSALAANTHLQAYKYDWGWGGRPHAQYLEVQTENMWGSGSQGSKPMQISSSWPQLLSRLLCA